MERRRENRVSLTTGLCGLPEMFFSFHLGEMQQAQARATCLQTFLSVNALCRWNIITVFSV